jgi:hypothetical protein
MRKRCRSQVCAGLAIVSPLLCVPSAESYCGIEPNHDRILVISASLLSSCVQSSGYFKAQANLRTFNPQTLVPRGSSPPPV